MQTLSVFPFRHIEERLLWYQIGALVLAGYVVYATFYTIYGFNLVGSCFALSAAIGMVIWRRIYRRHESVMPQIVKGKKRIFVLSAWITFCLGVLIAAAALVINRNTTMGPPRHIQAEVLRLSSPGFRTGWTADLEFGGDTHHLNIRPEHAQAMRCSNTVVLEIHRGVLGFDYITSVRCS